MDVESILGQQSNDQPQPTPSVQPPAQATAPAQAPAPAQPQAPSMSIESVLGKEAPKPTQAATPAQQAPASVEDILQPKAQPQMAAAQETGTGSNSHPSTLAKAWNWFSTGTIGSETLVRAMTGMTREQLNEALAPSESEGNTMELENLKAQAAQWEAKAKSDPKYAPMARELNKYIADARDASAQRSAYVREFTRGATGDIAELGSSYTSPLMIAMLGLGAVGKVMNAARGAINPTAAVRLLGKFQAVPEIINAAASLGFGTVGAKTVYDNMPEAIKNNPDAVRNVFIGLSQVAFAAAHQGQNVKDYVASLQAAKANAPAPTTAIIPNRTGTIAGERTSLRPTTQTTAGVAAPIAATQQSNPPLAARIAQRLTTPGAGRDFQKSQTLPAAQKQLTSALGQVMEDAISMHEAVAKGEAAPEPKSGTQTPSKFQTLDEAAQAGQRAAKQTWKKGDDIDTRETAEWQAKVDDITEQVKEHNKLVEEHNSNLDQTITPEGKMELAPGEASTLMAPMKVEDLLPEKPKTLAELRSDWSRAKANSISSDPAVRQEAFDNQIPDAEKGLDKWFKQHSDEITPEEYQSVKRLTFQHERIQEISNKLRAPMDKGTLTGNTLRQIEATMNNRGAKFGRPAAFKQLLGDAGYDNWRKIANVLDPIKGPGQIERGLEVFASTLLGHLMPAGIAAKLGTEFILNRALFNPEWGNWFAKNFAHFKLTGEVDPQAAPDMHNLMQYAHMTNDELLTAGFTQDQIDAGAHLPGVGGGAPEPEERRQSGNIERRAAFETRISDFNRQLREAKTPEERASIEQAIDRERRMLTGQEPGAPAPMNTVESNQPAPPMERRSADDTERRTMFETRISDFRNQLRTAKTPEERAELEQAIDRERRVMLGQPPDDRFSTIKPSYVKEGGKGFAEQNYPKSFGVRVTLPDGTSFEDEVKGLNEGHALSRAKGNWPDASNISVTGETTYGDRAMDVSAPEADTEKNMPAPKEVAPMPPQEQVAGGKFATPKGTYHEAAQGTGNPWVRRSADPANSAATTNEGRQLLVQISSNLINEAALKGAPESAAEALASKYYDKLYAGSRSGYSRMADFWEIPQWIGFASHMLPDADVYVVRNVADAIQFLNEAKYDRVAFSALDVNKDFIKQIAQGYEGHIDVGGYADKKHFEGLDNVKWHDSLASLAGDAGLEAKNGVDYRHFQGSDVIPRLTMSDGCLHKCAFCAIAGKALKLQPTEVIDQQAEAIANHGAKLVYVSDKTFGQAANHTHLVDLNNSIREKSPNFEGFIVQTTAAQMGKLTPEFLKASGIKYVELGIESYNDPILKEMHKPANEKIINQSVDKLRKAGIALIPNILVGFPGETAETYQHTLDFLQDNQDIISHANIYNLALYKDTELGKKVTTATEGDFNENVLEKSWYNGSDIHQKFAGDLYGLASRMLDKQPGQVAQPDGTIKQLTAGDIAPEAVEATPKEIADYHNKNRGFTYNPQRGFVRDQPVFSVGLGDEKLQKVFPRDSLTTSDVRRFMQQPEVREALKDPRNSIGGWNYKNSATLEVSRMFDNKDEAISEGKRLNQNAIYDHEHRAEIPTGGNAADIALEKSLHEQQTGRMLEKYGTTSDPLKPGFILPEGEMIPLVGEHDHMLGGKTTENTREQYIKDSGAIRARYRMSRAGEEMVFSTPSNVTPEQVRQIKYAASKLKYGRIIIENVNDKTRNEVIDNPTGQKVQEALDRISPVKTAEEAAPAPAAPTTSDLVQIGASPNNHADEISGRYRPGAKPEETLGLAAMKEAEARGPYRTGGKRTEFNTDEPLSYKQRMARTVANYPNTGLNFADDAWEKNPDSVINKAVGHYADNLNWLYDMVPDSIKEPAKQWYETAHDKALDIAKKQDTTPRKVAAVISVFSPANDWDNNLGNAERFIERYKNDRNRAWDSKMDKALAETRNKITNGQEQTAEFQRLCDDLRGKMYDQLRVSPRLMKSNPEKAKDALNAKRGLWLSIVDRAYGTTDTPLYDPQGNIRGSKLHNWGGTTSMAKAVEIMDGEGTPDELSSAIGDGHKTRTFYNNIVNPYSEVGHLTADTHAVRAAHLRAFTGDSAEVTHNFGSSKSGTPKPPESAAVGIAGTYPLYDEAYHRMAKEKGVRPNQAQSVVWEGIRSLLGERPQDYSNEIDRVWDDVAKRRISKAKAREAILKITGGFKKPAWMSQDTWKADPSPNKGWADDFDFGEEGETNPNPPAKKAGWIKDAEVTPRGEANPSTPALSMMGVSSYLLADGSLLSAEMTHGDLAKYVGEKNLTANKAIRVAGPYEYDVFSKPTSEQRGEIARIVKEHGEETGKYKMYWSMKNPKGRDVGNTGYIGDFLRDLDNTYGD